MSAGNLIFDYTYGNLLALVNSNNTLMLGFGGTAAWPIESAPPAPDPTLAIQPSLVGFIPISLKAPVAPALFTDHDYAVGQLFYKTAATPFTTTTLRDQLATYLYVAGSLVHNDLPISQYRSIGVYQGVTLNGGVSPNTFYIPSELATYSLVYLYNIPPVTKTTGLVEAIQLAVGV